MEVALKDMSVLTINLVYSQSLLDEYPKAFIVNADNVGSKQMQQIRQALRGKASMCLNAFNTRELWFYK